MDTKLDVSKEIPASITEETWQEVGWLSCSLSVDLPLPHFTVRDLLLLAPGSILRSQTPKGSDVPVSVNSQLVGWAEFEVVGQRLAVRLTGIE